MPLFLFIGKEEALMIRTVGDRIKEQRELIKMSQVELAEKMGVSKQTLYKYENNIVTNIPSDKIQIIAKVLGISPSYLMGWEHALTDDIAYLLSDDILLDNIKKLRKLNKEHQQTIFDNIAFWYEKEGH